MIQLRTTGKNKINAHLKLPVHTNEQENKAVQALFRPKRSYFIQAKEKEKKMYGEAINHAANTTQVNQNERMFKMTHLTTEIWQQDNQDHDLWHNNHGVIVNTPALIEREAYFDVVRVPASALNMNNELDSFIFEHH